MGKQICEKWCPIIWLRLEFSYQRCWAATQTANLSVILILYQLSYPCWGTAKKSRLETSNKKNKVGTPGTLFFFFFKLQHDYHNRIHNISYATCAGMQSSCPVMHQIKRYPAETGQVNVLANPTQWWIIHW